MGNRAEPTPHLRSLPFLLYGLLLGLGGISVLVVHGTSLFVSWLLGCFSVEQTLRPIQGIAVVILILGVCLASVDIFILLPQKRRKVAIMDDPPKNRRLTVALTAYNDEASIGLSVQDFRRHPLVERVIVVDNNSSDRTSEVAEKSGAIVVKETKPGYGQCVYRALSEAIRHADSELTLLCEGDMTFRAADIDKFMAYIPHAEIVNGTRIVEQLRAHETQLTTFMYYGNFFVGKLLEAKHLGWGTFTDVGTTYKLCRNRSLKMLLPLLNPAVNLEFNAHFLDTALRHGLLLVECPVTFHRRVGKSKGGNTGHYRALTVGLRMIFGLCVTWGSR